MSLAWFAKKRVIPNEARCHLQQKERCVNKQNTKQEAFPKHSLTPSSTRSLTWSAGQSASQSASQSLSLTRPLTHLLTHSLTQSRTHPLTQSIDQSPTHPPLAHSPTRSSLIHYALPPHPVLPNSHFQLQRRINHLCGWWPQQSPAQLSGRAGVWIVEWIVSSCWWLVDWQVTT